MKKLIIFIMLLSAANAFSQSFHVFDIDTTDFPIMRAKFYAFDAEGKQITNISPSEVTVTEDGNAREVLSISCPESKPVPNHQDSDLSRMLTLNYPPPRYNQYFQSSGAVNTFNPV